MSSSNSPVTARPQAFVSPKITDSHLQLGAVLYVRQSTSQQLRDHQESTARQYALKDRLLYLGWSDDRVLVIDDDLGVSGAGRADRPGFRRLLKLITDGQVGIVLGLEMSRLARNSKDWHDLFEVCAIFNALIADEDGVYDPHDPNDRLVLGLKGIISEMELHTMKVRLERGRLSKAQRGELFHDVPVGYVLDQDGLPRLDPDESARHAIRTFFDLFETVGSSSGLFHYLAEHNINLPFREQTRNPAGPIDWRTPAMTTVYELLRHPLYAGTYGYGRRKCYRQKTKQKTVKKYLPPEQWKVCIKDRHPAYITWRQYELNQQRLANNDTHGDRSGPVRGGSALLGGIVYCAHCGRRMAPLYSQPGKGCYYCSRHNTVARGESCHNRVGCAALDDLVSAKLLEALQPAGVDLSLEVVEDEVTRREQLDTLHAQRVEQAQYAVDLASRRYKEVDPLNRLVAGTLEKEWETSLVELQEATKQLDQFRNAQPIRLRDAERQELRRACADISALWRNHATLEQRKQIVRLMLRSVEVNVHNNTDRVTVRLLWSGGFESCHEMIRTVMRFEQMESYDQLLDRALGLALSGVTTPAIADVLKEEGFHSPRHDRPLSSHMVQKVLMEDPRSCRQLLDPPLAPGYWRSAELAKELGIREKRLKDWVTRGWATATQRPHGRIWVIYADQRELERLRKLVSRQTGQGSPLPPEELRTPAPIPEE